MKPLIVIGLGTKQRPQMLAQALESMIVMQLPQVNVHLVVCENGALNSAEQLVNSFRSKLPFKVSYIREEPDGIVFMRNRVLQEAARLTADYLAFLDDDEVVTPEWLNAMYDTMHNYSADVVQGFVKHIFPETREAELISNIYPGRMKYETGRKLKVAYTNNVLFRFYWVKNFHLHFDQDFNQTGGEDSFFFTWLSRLGAKIIFTREAVVEENIPASRCTVDWVLTRHYRNGYVTYLKNRKLSGPLIRLYMKTSVKMRMTFLKRFSSKANTPTPTVKVLKKLKRRAVIQGKYDAMKGLPFSEYHLIHGS